jgi:purine-binding chemotaxis protein CheW
MVQHFIFSAGLRRYAIPLTNVQSVIQMMEMTPSEGARPGMAGNINLHGRTIPVFSLNKSGPAAISGPHLTDMLIIAHAGDETVALWIEDTLGVGEPDVTQGDTPAPSVHHRSPPGTRITDTGIIVITELAEFITRGLAAQLPDDSGSAGTGDTPATTDWGDSEPDPGTVRAILAERAKKMLPPQTGTSFTDMAELLRFQLAYQEYAIEMNYVREVILTGEITPVPGTPDFIAGICSARGQIISLVDLRALFRIPEKGLTDLNRVIVMTNGEITFGILADTISGVGTVALDQIIPPQPGELSGGRKYLKGVLGRTTYLLDAAAILGDPCIIVDDA